jgi:hypothetical protein
MINEKRHGKGILRLNKPRINDSQYSMEYNGEWKNDKKDGKGILIEKTDYFGYSDPFVYKTYEGEFKNDKKHGKGIMKVEADGHIGDKDEKYEGIWENDELIKKI